MTKKIIEIDSCFECPNRHWDETYKEFACIIYDKRIISAIEKIADGVHYPILLHFNRSLKSANYRTILLKNKFY